MRKAVQRFGVVLLVIAGCAPGIRTHILNPPLYAMKPRPLDQVTVFTMPPKQPYVEIVMFEAKQEGDQDGRSPAGLLEEVRRRAGAFGCDGLVLLNASSELGWSFFGTGPLGFQSVASYRATCVQFKRE